MEGEEGRHNAALALAGEALSHRREWKKMRGKRLMMPLSWLGLGESLNIVIRPTATFSLFLQEAACSRSRYLCVCYAASMQRRWFG